MTIKAVKAGKRNKFDYAESCAQRLSLSLSETRSVCSNLDETSDATPLSGVVLPAA